jgi:hypothetical protein
VYNWPSFGSDPDVIKNFGSGSAINHFFCDLLDQPGVEILVSRLHDVPPLLWLINLPADTDKGTIRIFSDIYSVEKYF